MMRLAVAAVAILALAVPCAAQDFDIFDLSDIVDPRVYGTRFDDQDGDRVEEGGEDYNVLRGVFGGISQYARRSARGAGDVAFLQLESGMYRDAMQYNLKVSGFQVSGDDTLSRYRVTAEIGRYSLMAMTSDTEDEEPPPEMSDDSGGGIDYVPEPESADAGPTGDEDTVEWIPSRMMLVLTVEENRTCGSSRCEFPLTTEVGLQVDSLVPGTSSVYGSALLSWRDRTKHGGPQHRLSYIYQVASRVNRALLNVTFGFGFEMTSSIHMGPTRLGLGTAFDLGSSGTLNVAWTPTYVPSDPDRRLYNEVAVFVDSTIFRRLGKRVCVFDRCN